MTFEFEDYSMLIADYRTGVKLINVSATSLMILIMQKVFQEVNKDLTVILDEIQKPTFNNIRKFVVDYTQLDAAELVIFGAF